MLLLDVHYFVHCVPAAFAGEVFGGEDCTESKALTGFGFVTESEDVCLAFPAYLVNTGHFSFADTFNRAVYWLIGH